MCIHCLLACKQVRDWSLITGLGGGGVTKWMGEGIKIGFTPTKGRGGVIIHAGGDGFKVGSK